MATTNTVSTLSGLFKEVYAEKLEDLTPKGIKLMKDISFVPREQMPGNNFNQPVLLAHEQGFSYAAAGGNFGTVTSGTLENPVAGVTQNAQITGAQILLRSRIDYETAARASSGGVRAFRQAVDIVVENMWESCKKRLEISALYGQAGIGTIGTVSGAVSTNNTLYIQATHWAPGIWEGMNGARLRIYNTTTAIATSGIYTITKVDSVNKCITTTSTNSPALTSGDTIYFAESRTVSGTNLDQLGIHALLNNAGTYHGISATTYSLWKGTESDVGTLNLTMGKINDAVALAVGKGLDEDVVIYVNPEVWNDLYATEISYRRFTTQPKRGDYSVGAEGLEFYTQSGKITVKASIFVKVGFAYMLAPKLWRRVGATDLTFRLPDRGDEFFLHRQDEASYELRAYSNQAVFTKAPAKSCLLTGITSA